ncbi:hypothetical protein H0H81_003399 [Sphagnurus paluster]|uniref:Uncharacterized protein n=1 Tax=Sphagnurus paluster TaxID=117069 RepID=A0A9P7FLV6_9AGAR|nr:hypothetical protein H0H81_003399 [Sphagnurus paluster]
MQVADFPAPTRRRLKWSEVLRATLGITALAYMLGAIQVPGWQDCENFLADWVMNSVKDQTCKEEAIPEIRNECENQDVSELTAGDEEDECLLAHDDADCAEFAGAADLSWHSEDLEFGEDIEKSMSKFCENEDNHGVAAGDEEDECLLCNPHEDANYADHNGAADLSWHSEELDFGEDIEENMCKFD